MTLSACETAAGSGKDANAETSLQAQLEFIQGRHKPGAYVAAHGLSTLKALKLAGSYVRPDYWPPFILRGLWL